MAIRIDRVYTRTGDAGETGLAGGGRIPKDSPRIEAFGTVDELNCAIGVAAEELRALTGDAAGALRSELLGPLSRTQQKLFDLGGYLATLPEKFRPGMPAVSAEDVRQLEIEMDRWEDSLEPLKSFVLPGGGRLGGLLHVCRAVCRRAERETLRLHRSEPLAEEAIPFLNRLSDWFFVASRLSAKLLGEREVLWVGSTKKPKV
jgi:cob(I)alamin adenosyltransferase